MRFSFYIAARYLSSLRKKGMIGVLSAISVLGVAVASGALVIVLSAFNGLENLIFDLYKNFDPAIQIAPAAGKFFDEDSTKVLKIKAIPGVSFVTAVAEDNALLRYGRGQMVVRVKGVSEEFARENRLGPAMFTGKFNLWRGPTPAMVTGYGVAVALQMQPGSAYESAQLWYPRNKKGMSLDPERAFAKRGFLVEGVFRLEKEYDEKYVFVPLAAAQSLMERPGRITGYEVALAPDADAEAIRGQIRSVMGQDFKVLLYQEQHESLVKVLRIERLFTFVALSVILLIASFNIFTALSMLGVEKALDLSMFKAMGAPPGTVRRIFLQLGGLISAVGAFIGVALGAGLSWAQQTYGLVGMGIQSAIVSDYPMELNPMDAVWVLVTVSVVSFLVSIGPAARAQKSRFMHTA